VGSRSACEDALGKEIKSNNRIVLDRCNVEVADREYWITLAMRPKDCTAVFFDVPADMCMARVAGRFDHPTIAQGKGSGIIRSFAKKLQPPTRAEGFAAIHTISSIGDANALLRRWGAREIELNDDDEDDDDEAEAE
jgi:hypothetical protein